MDDLLGLIASERRKGKKRALFREQEEDFVKKGGVQGRDNWEKEQKGKDEEKQGKEADTGQGRENSVKTKKEQGEDGGKDLEKKEKDERKGNIFIRQFILWLSVAVLCPLALWLFRGMTAVFDNWKMLAAIDGGLLVILSAINIYGLFNGHRADNGDDTDSGEEQDPWRILYEDEDEDLDIQPSPVYTNENKNEYSQKIPQNSAEESFQTVLLSERPAEGEEVRRLSALNGSDEDIVISYFPFVIGKHKDLADYVLLKDTVSRFHIRLDENNGRYTVTDLNSTNGTRVRGRLLEANETTQLEPGDQIFMADCGYVFY